ncbi:MAG: hypothetical protein R3B48_06415 [Kofleriaceae bacterium]
MTWALVAALAGCGGDADEDARPLRELTDAELVASCQRERAEAGATALVGYQHSLCYDASFVGGACNATVYENCVAAGAPACTAPAADSPLRTCEATVGEARACASAWLRQFEAAQNASCAAAPPTPTARTGVAACAAFCAACPGAC